MEAFLLNSKSLEDAPQCFQDEDSEYFYVWKKLHEVHLKQSEDIYQLNYEKRLVSKIVSEVYL